MHFLINTLPVLWVRVENVVISIGVGEVLFVVSSLIGIILSVVKLLLSTTTVLRKKQLYIINKWMIVRIFIYSSSNM